MKNTARAVVPQNRNTPGRAAARAAAAVMQAPLARWATPAARVPSRAGTSSSQLRSPWGQAAQKSSSRCRRSSVMPGSPARSPGSCPSSSAAWRISCHTITAASASMAPVTAMVTTAAVNPRFRPIRRRHQAITGSTAAARARASRNGSSHRSRYRTPSHSSTAQTAQ